MKTVGTEIICITRKKVIELYHKTYPTTKNLRRKSIPLIDHDHSEPKIYNDSLLHHASVFEHQAHGHQSIGLAPYLPVMSNVEKRNYSDVPQSKIWLEKNTEKKKLGLSFYDNWL